MRYYKFVDTEGEWVLSEQDILVTYWKYWKEKMEEYDFNHTPRAKITPENCLQDWCTVHWAEEIVKKKYPMFIPHEHEGEAEFVFYIDAP